MIKNNDLSFTIIIAIAALAAAWFWGGQGYVLISMLMIGLALGFVLQRSRFCIASAFSDLLLFRDGVLFRAVLVFILVSTLGFYLVEINGGVGYVMPLGWRTVFGALLFGCGMVLAGGCAAGTLMRLGEGWVLFIPVLIGLVIGSALGAYHYGFWGLRSTETRAFFLPELIGWPAALILQVGVLAVLWLTMKRWEKR